MRLVSRAVAIGVSLALGGAILMSGPGTGCTSFLSESAVTSTDFCFIFDCQNGILGGTIDPCAGTETGDRSGELPLFTDCPNYVASGP